MSVLKVGFFSDVKTKSYMGDGESDVASVARGIEEGSFENSPERPFMKYTQDKYSKDWRKLFKDKVKQSLIQQGKNKNFSDACNEAFFDLASQVIDDIRSTMNEANAFAELSDFTRKARKAGGVSNDNPFIATGSLYESVSARVEE